MAMEDKHKHKHKEENQQVLKVLEALKQASHSLQTNPTHSLSTNALLELETEADAILSTDPHLSTLSHHLTKLKTLINSLEENKRRQHGLRSFLSKRVWGHEIGRVAGVIEREIQGWIDRECIECLSGVLCEANLEGKFVREEGLVEGIEMFRKRISLGFNRELQDLILKSKVFQELESILCGMQFSKRVREAAALTISDLIRFNKDVFVGQVLMGKTIQSLVCLSTPWSIKVLSELIKSIKSPLVDEIESNGQIPKIIHLLTSQDLSLCIMVMECVLEIGYFGRKEAIEAMMNSGLISKLVELQRSEMGGELIDAGRFEEREKGKMGFLERHPFASCVARFAVQLEVGEGLRQREKREFKAEILKRVREVSVDDAEAATIIAEVLWGSSP